MLILGVETSCDETAAAVVENGRKILSNVVASSVEFHKKAGGIIPEVAAREQIKCIIPVIEESIKSTTGTKGIKGIDALAVTVGPGLIGSLLVGVETARTLAYVWNKPIIPINHLVAHIYANWLHPKLPITNYQLPQFPAIALVVSGGHTDLVLMENHPSRGRGKLHWLGGTRDDAAGECFDKCARVLGLGYPGGPAIAAAAKQKVIRDTQYVERLPRPMMEEKNFDFSFSGLKTAVIKEVSKVAKVSEVSKALAFEIQEAITDVLVKKTIRAAEKFKVKSLLLAGGVAANQRLREKFRSKLLITNYPAYAEASAGRQLLIPPPRLCTDNAAVVASCAFFNHKPLPWKQITAKPGLYF